MNPIFLAGIGATAAWVMKERFDNRLERDIRALSSKRPLSRDLTDLPEPVRAAVERARREHPDTIAVSRLTQHGRLRRRPGDAWSPYDATLHLAVGHPGFVWHAHLARLGWLASRSAESLCFDTCRSESRLLGVPLETEPGSNLLRAQRVAYLSELPWVPHAMADNPSLTFTTGTDGVVTVALDIGEEPIRLDIEFTDSGDIARVRGPRPRFEATGTRDVMWSREYGDYAKVDGLRVPRHSETRWETDPPFVYMRTHVTALSGT